MRHAAARGNGTYVSVSARTRDFMFCGIPVAEHVHDGTSARASSDTSRTPGPRYYSFQRGGQLLVLAHTSRTSTSVAMLLSLESAESVTIVLVSGVELEGFRVKNNSGALPVAVLRYSLLRSSTCLYM